MDPRTHAPTTRTDRLLLGLTASAFLVVALLLVQGVAAARSYRLVAEAALDDFAGFAAQRLATELNGTFAAIFLDQIAAGRAAHEAWLVGGNVRAQPRGRWSLPPGAVGPWFSLEGDRFALRGRGAGLELEREVLDFLVPHARDVYPPPAPYAVLRTRADRAVVYRKGVLDGRESLYGFVVHLASMGRIYANVLAGTPLLPPSLAGDFDTGDLLSVEIRLNDGERPLYTRPGPGPDPTHAVRAEASAAKAARLVARVDLDASRMGPLLGGGDPAARVRLLLALSALTGTLLAVAVVAFRRADRLVRARENFLANASHELRTPLSQIRMFSETLLLGRLEDGGERRRSLEIIRREAASLSTMVENILLASGREGEPPRREATELARALAETLESLLPLARSREAELRAEVDPDAVAQVDRSVFRRIVVNLVDNALKYGPRGQTVRVGVVRTNGRVEITVHDEGPGIAPADRARVWERFVRLGRDGDAGGTGIGLAVVRDLALRHGGTVRMEGGESGGARVVVSLSTEAVAEPPS